MGKNFEGRTEDVKRGTLVYRSHESGNPGIVITRVSDSEVSVAWLLNKRGEPTTQEPITALKDYGSTVAELEAKVLRQRKTVEALQASLKTAVPATVTAGPATTKAAGPATVTAVPTAVPATVTAGPSTS